MTHEPRLLLKARHEYGLQSIRQFFFLKSRKRAVKNWRLFYISGVRNHISIVKRNLYRIYIQRQHPAFLYMIYLHLKSLIRNVFYLCAVLSSVYIIWIKWNKVSHISCIFGNILVGKSSQQAIFRLYKGLRIYLDLRIY